MSHFFAFSLSLLLLAPGQVRDGYKDPPAPTFGHLTRAENELKPEERKYFHDVSARFDDLWEYFAEAEKQRRKLAAMGPSANQIDEMEKDYRAVLVRVERSAVGLHHKLAPKLPGLQHRKGLDWAPAGTANAERFEAEMEFIRSNIREAERRFRKRCTEKIVFTEGENLLIRLNWVAKMAQQVRRQLGT